VRPTDIQRHVALVACGLALGITAGADAASALTGDTSSRSEPRVLYMSTAKHALVRLNSRDPQRPRARRPISGLPAGPGIAFASLDRPARTTVARFPA
jgi:hypothetical protein